MQTLLVEDFCRALVAAGWHVEHVVEPSALPSHVNFRDDDHASFVRTIRACESPDRSGWLLSLDDYMRVDGEGWDFIERQICQAVAVGDPEYAEEMRIFWKSHLPIAVGSRDDYCFFAIDDALRVVYGRAPQFEDVEVVAGSFREFVEQLREELMTDLSTIRGLWGV